MTSGNFIGYRLEDRIGAAECLETSETETPALVLVVNGIDPRLLCQSGQGSQGCGFMSGPAGDRLSGLAAKGFTDQFVDRRGTGALGQSLRV